MSYLHSSDPVSTPPAAPAGPPTITPDDLAPPWKRVAAVLIDSLLWAIPFAAFYVIVSYVPEGPTDSSFSFDTPWWYWVVSYGGGFLYQIVPIAIWGQTLGKHFLGIRVVSAQDLNKPGWWRAIRRWGIYIVVGVVPFVGGGLNMVLALVGLVMLFVHQRRQTPHDLVGDTLVVNNGVHRW